jgi:hypothetical protein
MGFEWVEWGKTMAMKAGVTRANWHVKDDAGKASEDDAKRIKTRHLSTWIECNGFCVCKQRFSLCSDRTCKIGLESGRVNGIPIVREYWDAPVT